MFYSDVDGTKTHLQAGSVIYKEMADVAGENEADSGSGGPSTVAEGSGTPEDDLERNDSDRVTGNIS